MLYLMHFNLKVIIFNSIYIKANYNVVKGTRYIVQNLNHIFKRNLRNTYKPFLPLPSTPQLYHVYFYYRPSPINSYKLLQTPRPIRYLNKIAIVRRNSIIVGRRRGQVG